MARSVSAGQRSEISDQRLRQGFDPAAGRLPTPVVVQPISRERFQKIADHVRGQRAWLSLWNQEGTMTDCDEGAGPFWDSLRGRDQRSEVSDQQAGFVDESRRASGFVDGLREIALSSMESDAGRGSRSSSGSEVRDQRSASALGTGPDRCPLPSDLFPPGLGPWAPDLGVVAIPVIAGRRRVGCILAMAVLTERPGEALARLCSRCGLDLEHMARLMGRAGRMTPMQLRHTAGTLAFLAGQAREIEIAADELSILTDNLEHTYEELHLIYEISRQMGIPQKPTTMVERVGREVVEVSRAAGIGFALVEHDAHSPGGAAGDRLAVHDGIVQVGEAAPTESALRRLDEILRPEHSEGPSYLLMNEARQRPELAWAADWLKHLLVLPMRHEGSFLGTMYAVNCKDAGDFTSVDVQLLRAVADRVTAALQNQYLYDDLTDLLMGLMHAMVNSVDAKDPYTFGHSERVAFFSRALARAMGMSPTDCERVYLSGLLHDVGKIGVPDAILCKPGKLTQAEFDALKKHPEIGERILSRVRQIRDLMPGVLYHHERMDGRGYPQGLVGRDIPLLGRILCLADSFDAMTTNRTYRAAMPVALAVAEVRRCAGNQFDPALAEQMVKLDLERLFKQAHAKHRSDTNIGRIGALCAALSGFSTRSADVTD